MISIDSGKFRYYDDVYMRIEDLQQWLTDGTRGGASLLHPVAMSFDLSAKQATRRGEARGTLTIEPPSSRREETRQDETRT
ncbi:hypothetical protein X798_02980 [Onchocerca flexuosa]|uniref:Uncharacterized protein n=1 Tax=Onchocerca flexuosa TaxID=387005 RepID=A0A238BXT8_9BILA|nr:hypothetical protein X798_02980 [Onchocerca flexuosa]